MIVATLTRSGPRGFVPPADLAVESRPRLSHLDPSPLWLEAAVAESPWKSPAFWVAYALVMPIAVLSRLFRR